MRIFVSYARVDKPYCVQLVEVLDFHEVWYDQRLSAGQKWWKEILYRLEWCDGLIYLISNDSLNSEYCRREFEIAQSLGKHIFPVIIQEDIVLPESLSHIQYANLSYGLTAESVHNLLRGIYIAEQADWRRSTEEHMSVVTATNIDSIDVMQNISDAAKSMEKGDYERAIQLLSAVLKHEERPRFINVEKMKQEAEAAVNSQELRRKLEEEYLQILELVRLPATRSIGLEAFEAFRKDNPDYDPENIKSIINQTMNGHKSLLSITQGRTRRIPLLEWCEIPKGVVRINQPDNNVPNKEVGDFLMARYPVTNKQYQAFVNAPNGYANGQWWSYHPLAKQWHAENQRPRASKFEGSDRPRENVNWYEARAFCNWLSDLLKLEITLPTLLQRQRAIMGDDERIFPWGSDFHQSCCNTRENGLRMTTVVNRYPSGQSPYGVFDLAGNVWEWCMDSVQCDDDEKAPEKVIVHGGAWVSPYNRCHVAHSYMLPPTTHFASIGFRIVCLSVSG